MGQKQVKTKKSTVEKSALPKEAEMPNDFLGEIPEVASNICGLLADDYLIVSFWDDPMERDFCFYHVYDFDALIVRLTEQEFTFAVIARPEVKRAKSSLSMNAFYKVVLKMGGRSRHIPNSSGLELFQS
uniref:Uncharacterized protein n=1 Tax=Ditylenchus dipsaci TaxID=166011 RepID=A0A915DPW9_9BILA